MSHEFSHDTDIIDCRVSSRPKREIEKSVVSLYDPSHYIRDDMIKLVTV